MGGSGGSYVRRAGMLLPASPVSGLELAGEVVPEAPPPPSAPNGRPNGVRRGPDLIGTPALREINKAKLCVEAALMIRQRETARQRG